MTIETTVQIPFRGEPVTCIFALSQDTVATLDQPTRCGSWSKRRELERLAAKISGEILRGGVRGLQAIARHHGLGVTEGRWLHHNGHALVTELVGTDDQSREDVAGQLSGSAWLLHEVERRICALLGRDVRVIFADVSRVELVENPAYSL